MTLYVWTFTETPKTTRKCIFLCKLSDGSYFLPLNYYRKLCKRRSFWKLWLHQYPYWYQLLVWSQAGSPHLLLNLLHYQHPVSPATMWHTLSLSYCSNKNRGGKTAVIWKYLMIDDQSHQTASILNRKLSMKSLLWTAQSCSNTFALTLVAALCS